MMKRKNSMRRILSLVLCIFIIFPTAVFAQQSAVDYSGHWAEKQIKNFLEKGFVSLYKDGTFKPDNPITKADFAAMANKAFGFMDKDTTNFKDVEIKDAFYNDMAIAKKAGYLTGLPDGTVKPNGYMNRQEYAVIISRLLKLDTKKDIAAADKFKDAAKIPGWSKGAIGAVAKLGYMKGGPDNAFDPTGSITRGQAVTVLERCYLDHVKVAYNKPGTYTGKNIEGSVAINAPDVVLENTVIAGNLLIGEGVGNGNVRLKNVTVNGNTIVRGGGPNSIIIEDCTVKNIIVIKEDNKVRVVAVGKTTVERVDMQSGGELEEQNATGNGFGYVTIAESVDPNELIVLKGSFESVQVQADNAKIDVVSGSVGKIEVSQSAANANINIATGVKVDNLVVGAKATVTGNGQIGTAEVKVEGVAITVPVTTIKATEGVTVATTPPAPTTPTTPTAPTPSTGGGGSSGGHSGGSSGGGNDSKPSITISSIPAQTVRVGSAVEVAVNSTPSNTAVSAVSKDTKVATVAVSGNKVTVNGIAEGTATITVTCEKSGYTSASTMFTINVNPATADMALELTTPSAGEGNSISVGGAVKIGVVNVVNGTSSVVLTGTKTAAQTVAIDGENAAVVTAGGTATAPTYTVNTADIAAAGGSKAFTLTVSETGKSSITYNIKVTVAALTPAEPLGQVERPVLSAAGIATWTDVANEEGYSVQLYKDGAAVDIGKVKVSADKTSYSFIIFMKSVGPGVYTVKVTAIGDGATYQDGPQSEASNGITQLAEVTEGLTWTGNVAHWTEVANADSYDVYLYRDGTDLQTINVPAANAAAGADFSAYITEDGTYTFKVVAKGDGTTEADAVMSSASNSNVRYTAADADKLAADKAALNLNLLLGENSALNNITVKLGTLPTTLTNGTTVVWTSDKPAVVSNDGQTVVRPAWDKADVTVVMTAALTNGNASDTVTFTLTVKKAEGTSEQKLAADKAALTLPLGENSAFDIITGKLGELSTTLANGTTVVWTSSNTAVVSDSGQTVVRPAWVDGDATVTMTAALTNGLATGTKTFTLIVKCEGTEAQELAADKAALTIPLRSSQTIVNLALDRIQHKLGILPTSLPYGTTVIWKSDNPSVLSDDGQIINRGTEDVTVTMTATLTNGTMTDTKIFTLTVRKKYSYDIDIIDVQILKYDGIARWNDVSYETGYKVRLYKDDIAVATKDVAANTTSADFRQDMLNAGAGIYEVTVQALGDYIEHEDGDESYMVIPQFRVRQLASAENLHWEGSVAHWTSVEYANSYTVSLYLDGQEKLLPQSIPAANVEAGVDFTTNIEESKGGTYTFKVVAKGDGKREADSDVSLSSGLVKLPLTADMNLVLTNPTGVSDIINTGGSVWIGTINVENGTKSVTFAGTKTVAQAVEIGGMNAASVTAGGTDTAPIFTMDTADISEGGNKAFTLTVSEEGKSKVVYRITVTVEALPPTLTKDGVAQWTDVSYETGYSVQMYKGESKLGAALIVPANTTSYDFSSIMDEVSKTGGGSLKVTVTALGKDTEYLDGPESPVSNIIRQLPQVKIARFINEAAFWNLVNSGGYKVVLYKDDILIASKTISHSYAGSGVDFRTEMAAAGDGVYTLRITSVSTDDGVIGATIERDSPISDVLGYYNRVSTNDIGLTLVMPAPDANNIMTDLGKDKKIIDVANGIASVIIQGTTTSAQDIMLYGENWNKVSRAPGEGTGKLQFIVDTTSISNGGRIAFNMKVTEQDKAQRIYVITVTVAAPNIGSLTVKAADDNLSDDKTVITVTEAVAAENELVYRNFGSGTVTLPVLDEIVDSGWTMLPSGGIITAADGDSIVVVERRTGTNKAKRVGQATAVVEAEIVPDTMAPQFGTGYPYVGDIGATSLTLFSQLDEAGTVYYSVYEAVYGAEAPTVEALVGEGTAVSAPGTKVVSNEVTGLKADTAYDIYIVAEDEAGNLQAAVTKLNVKTEAEIVPDTMAPQFGTGYPYVGDIGTTSLTLFSQLDEAGTVYYSVYEAVYGAEAPTVEVLVGEGIEVSVPGTDEISVEVNGLTAGTTYDIYVVAEDKNKNFSDIKMIKVKTLE